MMASVTRQPFAPLDETRLLSLTSAKNRQNAITPTAVHGKRKAELLDLDFENVDPLLPTKRSKAEPDTHTKPKYSLKKSSTSYLLNTASATRQHARTMSYPAKPVKASRAQPQTPLTKQALGATKSPLSVPAGRSPSRLKRPGIQLSRRRSARPYTRVDPPCSRLDSSAAPFSLDAAVRGTIAGYGPRPKLINKDRPSSGTKGLLTLPEPDFKEAWFFDIHEDTPEQEMTNLLQHGTCALHILSEDESERKAMLERAEGRDKENVPPAHDISQALEQSICTPKAAMTVEKKRVALGEMNTTDFYPNGCDESSIVIVPGDEEPSFPSTPHPQPQICVSEHGEDSNDADSPMRSLRSGSFKPSAVPLTDDSTENFDLWESGSAQDATEPPSRLP